MAGKTPANGKTGAKGKTTAKAPAKAAAAKPKASAKAPATPVAKRAAKAPKAAKPAPAKPAAPKALPAGAPGMVLALGEEARLMPGCGFGIGQSVVIGSLDVKLPEGFDLAAIERQMAEFALAPIEYVPPGKDMTPEAHLVGRIHVWHATIQRDAKVPAFGGCRIWDRGATGADGSRRIGFAVPSYARIPTIATIGFVIEAIAALAPGGAKAEAVLPAVRERFQALLQVVPRYAVIGTNAMHFIEAAHLLGIERYPVIEHMWAYGLGRKRSILNSTVTSVTPHFGVSIAKDKLRCNKLLAAAGMPVAQGGLAEDADAAAKLAAEIGYPVVVKPVDADQGLGVTAGIADEADLRQAFAAAAQVSPRVMVEKHHDGADYRVTVLHGKAIKVMNRRPAGVTGDGKATVAELVDELNEGDRAKRAAQRKQRPPLTIDGEAQMLLKARGYTGKSVVPAGEFVPLRRKGNVSAGGTYEVLAPEAIHPDNRQLAVNATITVGLDIAGIDIISGDPMKSWRETGGIICEVNAQPQIGYRDTESIYGEILTAVLGGGKAEMPVHLLIVQDGAKQPGPPLELAKSLQCNAAAWGTTGWIAGAGEFGPFANVFRAAKAVLLDRRVTGGLVVMTESEVGRLGLPAMRFASIRFIGPAGWQPSPLVQQIVGGHSQQIVRQPARPRPAPATA